MHCTALRALVVNDVKLARWALDHALTTAGFAVTAAETMETALAAVAHPDALDVVVASLSYGPGDIDRLLAHLNAKRPEAAVILLATDVDARVPVPTDNRAVVLDTPFSMDDVVAAVRRLVPGRDAARSDDAIVVPVAVEDERLADT